MNFDTKQKNNRINKKNITIIHSSFYCSLYVISLEIIEDKMMFHGLNNAFQIDSNNTHADIEVEIYEFMAFYFNVFARNISNRITVYQT